MSITYQCERCGRWYTVGGGKVGSVARCRDCDHEMVVPNTPDLLDDMVDGPSYAREPAAPRTASGPGATIRPAPRPSPVEAGKGGWGGAAWIAVVLVIFVLRLAGRGPMFRGPRVPRPRPQQAARPLNRQVAMPDLAAPVPVPARFPELGEPRRIEPGVLVHEVRIKPPKLPAPPGHAIRLWLYLPTAGARPGARSLPCVLVAPSGGSTMTGATLGEDDRADHLPYARAGFAVLAFELDGADPVPHRVGPAPTPSIAAFVAARAGLADGRVAIEFLRARAPEVDPDRLYVAGRGSAGTFAILLAEREPALKGCVAFAPIVDLEEQLGDRGGQATLRMLGLGDFFKKFSPRRGEADLKCPLFLYHDRDDLDVPVEQSIACADRLKLLRKDVTLDLADPDAPPDRGPRDAVAWLLARDKAVRGGR